MGITLLISGQALFNIAMVCGIMPVTGVPLPFVSYGGSSLLMNFMAIGLLASIGRRNVEGVKQVGTAEPLLSLREETQSRFKPSATTRTNKTNTVFIKSRPCNSIVYEWYWYIIVLICV